VSRKRKKAAKHFEGGPANIAAWLLDRMEDPHMVVGPLCQREDVPSPYFMVGTADRDGPHVDMVRVGDDIVHIALKKPIVMHVCDDERSMAKWCHLIWPCEKTESIRAAVEADFAVKH
jgi:hypothetical protein